VNHPRALSRRISVEGHADAIGSQGYNLPLSQRRAETVAQELIANQTRRERVRSQGFGELYPIAPNTNPDGSDNPAGRAKNRRVEVFLEN
jgi:outer membrane protein OmpA-like peptidoglycan-associated protein